MAQHFSNSCSSQEGYIYLGSVQVAKPAILPSLPALQLPLCLSRKGSTSHFKPFHQPSLEPVPVNGPRVQGWLPATRIRHGTTATAGLGLALQVTGSRPGLPHCQSGRQGAGRAIIKRVQTVRVSLKVRQPFPLPLAFPLKTWHLIEEKNVFFSTVKRPGIFI